jgi:hypothetical protein
MGTEASDGVVVLCGCGVRYTTAEWVELDLVGVQDDGEGALIELRNCPCGTTRARNVDFRAAVRLLNETAKRLRRALGRLRTVERATVGISAEIAEIDRGAVKVDVIEKTIRAGVGAVERERDRCAAIVDAYVASDPPRGNLDMVLSRILTAIRHPGK